MATTREREGVSGGGSPWRVPALVLVLAVVVPLLNVVPTLEGAWREPPPESEYLGFRWLIGDHLQYGAFARQGEAGRLLMENLFTTEAQRPSYILLYFNVVGLTMRFSGLAFPVAWEVLRVASGFGLLVAAWYFVCLCFGDRRRQMQAWMMVAFSGGLYWMASLLPAGALSRPGYPFLTDPAHFQWNWSTFGSMLMALWIAPVMLCLVAGVLLLSQRFSGAGRWAGTFALGPLIWFVHPHTGNVAYFAFGLFGLSPALHALWNLEAVPWKRTARSFLDVLPFILSFAVVVGYLTWASTDAVFAAGGKGAAEWNPAYSVFWYPLVYGLLLPFGLLGIRWSASMPEGPRRFVLAWLAAAFILSVNPLFSGVKYQFLIHLPLAIMASHGIDEMRERSAWLRRASKGFTGLAVGALLFVHGPVSILRDMSEPVQEMRAYAPRPRVEAGRWLDGQPDGTILCGYQACGDLAYLTGKKVYTGHWLLTLDQPQKHRELAAFFRAGIPANLKLDFLRHHGIRYVYYGLQEREMGSVDPALLLQTVYDRDGVTIYKVP